VICGMSLIGIAGFITDGWCCCIGRRLLRWSPSHVEATDADHRDNGRVEAVRAAGPAHRALRDANLRGSPRRASFVC